MHHMAFFSYYQTAFWSHRHIVAIAIAIIIYAQYSSMTFNMNFLIHAET